MASGIQLKAIFIANGMALLLASQLLFGNNWRYAKNNKEYKYLRLLIYMSSLACIIDPIVFLADGHPGLFCWLIVYVGNMILFIEDILVGLGWLVLVCKHLIGRVPDYQKKLITILSSIGLIAIVVNLFIPVVFYVDESSIYHRQILFWLFTFIEGVFILDGVFVYFYSRMQGGIFKLFPVVQFVVPTVTGIIVQGAFYGVSTVYPAAMISFAGLFNSLRNEALFRDSLTNLYNRSLMDELNDQISKKSSITALMLDVNDFKSINDKYGHAQGDAALIRIATILKNTVGALGIVIRYAGDEFVILLNTDQTEIIEGCIQSIHRTIDDENRVSNKEYKLSLSIGYCSLNETYQTLDDILSEADRKMYIEKQAFYSDPKKDRRNRFC